VPPHVLTQDEVTTLSRELFRSRAAAFERLAPAFANAGVLKRHSAVPLDWYRHSHGWVEKNALFVTAATALLEEAGRAAIRRAGLAPDQIDSVVAVSTTGIATPSLDARLIDRLGLRRDVQRLPIFGLGCAGGVLGLARGAALAQTRPGSHVLVLVVELCGLTFRSGDLSNANIIATALFGDGAAAAVLSTVGDGPALGPSGEFTWPDSLDVMGWQVEEDGLGVVFARDIPALVRTEMRQATHDFLARHGRSLGDIDSFVCHPGGTKVIAALEAAYGLPTGHMSHARAVLADYGNMSAATVLFVLERALAANDGPRLLLTALGPGFTAGFLILHTA
jgi:alkylresorcinol/alkylpyrone synthase